MLDLDLPDFSGILKDVADSITKPKPKPKKLPNGVTRLQQFTGDVAVPAPAAPTTYTSYSSVLPTYGRSDESGQSATYGQDGAASPGSKQLSLGQSAPVPVEEEASAEVDMDSREKTYRARKTKQMGWDAYRKLTDQQRGAVNFNTMLVQARSKDLRKEGQDYEQTDAQQETYDKAVERMFGEDGTSETYAPETVALLNQLDFKGTDYKRGDDLDDFLGLSAAIGSKGLKGMGLSTEALVGSVVEAVTPSSEVSPRDFAASMAGSTENLTTALVQGNQILENFKKVAMTARNEELRYLGGTENRLLLPNPRMPASVDEAYFETAFQALANAGVDPGVSTAIRQDLEPKGQYKDFLAYADTKSKYASDYSTGLGGDPTVQYRTPEEFRKILGLNKGGGDDGTA